MSTERRWFTVGAAVLAAAATTLVGDLAPSGAQVHAAAEFSCPTTTVAEGGLRGHVAFASDSTGLVFVSSGDHAGENGDGGAEIFRFDPGDGMIRQVSNDIDDDLDSLVFSGDASRAAFISYADPLGQNADHNTELFVFDLPTDTLTQVTHTLGGDDGPTWSYTRAQQVPMLDGDGDRVIFYTKVRHGTGDAATAPHSFVMADLATGAFTSLGRVSWPDPRTVPPVDVDAAGRQLVYGADGEIFLRDLDTGAITQLTDDPEHPSEAPSITPDGTTVFYRSRVSRSFSAVYRRDLLTGVTNRIVGANPSSPTPAADPSANGDRLLFGSDVDHLGDNPDGEWRQYLRDVATETMAAVGQDQFSFGHAIADDGTRVAYLARNAPSPSDPDGSIELVVADCGSGPLGMYRRPDLLLRSIGQRNLVGGDVYDEWGSDQTRWDRVLRRPTTVRFAVRLQNDGSEPDSFVLRADGGAPRFALRYLDGSIDVTAAMTDGGYEVGPLDRGQTHKIVAEVRVFRRAASGSSADFGVEVAPAGGGGGADRVVQTIVVGHQV